RSGIDSARWVRTAADLRSSARITSFRKVALRWLDSTSVSSSFGDHSFSGNPGKPAPDPTSITDSCESRVGKSCLAANSDSPKCLVTISSGSLIDVRLSLAFHLRSRSIYVLIKLSLEPVSGDGPANGASSSGIRSMSIAFGVSRFILGWIVDQPMGEEWLLFLLNCASISGSGNQTNNMWYRLAKILLQKAQCSAMKEISGTTA